MKKKVLALVSAVVLAVSTFIPAFAAPSPSTSGVVSGVEEAKDAEGNDVDIKVIKVAEAKFTPEEEAAVNEIRNIVKVEEVLKAVLGDKIPADFKETMTVADIKDVVIVGDASLVKFPLKITFKLAGVTTESKVHVLHYDTKAGAWEVLESKVGNGTVTATFNSLSPVAFVVDKKTAEAGEGTSPTTGESYALVIAALAVCVGLVGMTVVSRKRKMA